MRKLLLAGTAGLALIIAPAALSQSSFFKQNPTESAALSVDGRGVLTMAPLIDRVSPTVVSIRTEGKAPEKDETLDERQEMLERFFGRRFEEPQQRRSAGLGSGVIVDADAGYILTNFHVIDDAETITVSLTDKRELTAKLVGGDKKTDIAVLQIDAKNLKEVKLADDGDAKVGDYVIAIGNPFGLGHTVTTGIVSALGREISRGENSYQDFIQTDASINPGNSGGALVNSKGELIGINSAIISRSGGNNGIGFAVPTKMARSVMNQLIAYGEVKRGRIGVSIRDITPDFKEAYELSTMEGAFVNDVTEDSPAEKAGIKAEDIIISFNGEDIRDSSDIRNAVGMVEPGKSADITYLRDGKRRTSKITVEAVKDELDVLDESAVAEIPAMESFSGATITNIPDDLNLRGGDDGAYVSNVRPGSKAQRAGLAKGDVIRRVGRTKIAGLSDFEEAISKKDGPIALTVERDGTNLFLAVR